MEGAEFVWKLGTFLIAAGAVYGGIRSDLREIHSRIRRNENSLEALRVRVEDCRLYNRRHDDVR